MDKIKEFEQKIDLLDKEIYKRDVELKKMIQQKVTTNEGHKQNETIICRYHNRGYCRRKSWCTFKHSTHICEIFLKDGNCFDKDCASRHPNNCKYQKDGCRRGDSCAYNHSDSDAKLYNKYESTDRCVNPSMKQRICLQLDILRNLSANIGMMILTFEISYLNGLFK